MTIAFAVTHGCTKAEKTAIVAMLILGMGTLVFGNDVAGTEVGSSTLAQPRTAFLDEAMIDVQPSRRLRNTYFDNGSNVGHRRLQGTFGMNTGVNGKGNESGKSGKGGSSKSSKSSKKSEGPSMSPSVSPAPTISAQPSSVPSLSSQPSSTPSEDPTDMPSEVPSDAPSEDPSSVPSSVPTVSNAPSMSSAPSSIPTVSSAPSFCISVKGKGKGSKNWKGGESKSSKSYKDCFEGNGFTPSPTSGKGGKGGSSKKSI